MNSIINDSKKMPECTEQGRNKDNLPKWPTWGKRAPAWLQGYQFASILISTPHTNTLCACCKTLQFILWGTHKGTLRNFLCSVEHKQFDIKQRDAVMNMWMIKKPTKTVSRGELWPPQRLRKADSIKPLFISQLTAYFNLTSLLSLKMCQMPQWLACLSVINLKK